MSIPDRRLVWLASYPKSGNTWLRLLLANFQNTQDAPVAINNLGFVNAANRVIFDKLSYLVSSELRPDEIRALRPRVYRELSRQSSEDIYVKIHDRLKVSEEYSLIPTDVTRCVLYVVRNPFDVAVSLAHHMGVNTSESIQILSEPDYTISNSFPRFQLPQQLGTWSEHVSSWLDSSPVPVHVVRYEDLHDDTTGTFSDALRFVGHSAVSSKVDQAVRFSSFQRVKQSEELHGFKERSEKADSFFRKGIVGDWRNRLTLDEIAQIKSDHGPVMRRLGYLE